MVEQYVSSCLQKETIKNVAKCLIMLKVQIQENLPMKMPVFIVKIS
jgi:hypothetical protein